MIEGKVRETHRDSGCLIYRFMNTSESSVDLNTLFLNTSSSLAGAKMRSMSAFSRMHPFRDEEQGLLYQSDGEIMPISNLEDFLTEQNPKAMKTGRQRKKQAARTKGGEFQAKPKKRRVYFACISKEIDIQKLTDFFEEKAESSKGPEVPWQCTSYGDVLRLFKPAPDILLPPSIPIPYVPERLSIPALKPFQRQFSLESANGDAANDTHPGSPLPLFESQEGRGYDTESKGLRKEEWDGPTIDAYNARAVNLPTVEIFVFDFGVAVFWGVAKVTAYFPPKLLKQVLK